jgi:hypothetical protein
VSCRTVLSPLVIAACHTHEVDAALRRASIVIGRMPGRHHFSGVTSKLLISLSSPSLISLLSPPTPSPLPLPVPAAQGTVAGSGTQGLGDQWRKKARRGDRRPPAGDMYPPSGQPDSESESRTGRQASQHRTSRTSTLKFKLKARAASGPLKLSPAGPPPAVYRPLPPAADEPFREVFFCR